MAQQPLFVEDIYDALKAIVSAAGGPKAVGARLFPHKSADSARGALLDSLNSARAEKLDPEQVLLLLKIGREVGYHGAKHWIDSETGYSVSMPVEPDDQAAELARVISNAADQVRRATDALERIQGRGKVAAIR